VKRSEASAERPARQPPRPTTHTIPIDTADAGASRLHALVRPAGVSPRRLLFLGLPITGRILLRTFHFKDRVVRRNSLKLGN
jgi:hypothetical protein